LSDVRTGQFVRLLLANERKLFAYTYSLVGNVEDAREIVQDAAVTMWQQFGEYDPERPFFPWAASFAYYRVLRLRRQRATSRVDLTDEALEVVADEFARSEGELGQRGDALTKCVDRLPAPARKLLRHRYHDNQPIQEIAQRTGRSANAIYKALDRIRSCLMDCVERKIAEGQA
jgi:RNA polymerase sigma-70 factor (ECF subfamily)